MIFCPIHSADLLALRVDPGAGSRDLILSRWAASREYDTLVYIVDAVLTTHSLPFHVMEVLGPGIVECPLKTVISSR